MRTLQTILLKTAPDSSTAIWDLSVLKSRITTDERHAQAAGENLGTKLDASHQSNALMAETQARKVGCHNPNDPTWLSHQMCWWCGKVGHIRQKCTASQGEKEAYRVAKAKGAANVNAASDESDTYARALVAEEILHVDAAPTISGDVAKQWLIDTGCTSHSAQTNPTSFPTPHTPRAAGSALVIPDPSHPLERGLSNSLA